MIEKISKTIRLLYETIRFGAKETGEKAKPYAKLYIKGLLLIALIAIFSPIPFLTIGIIEDWRWLIALTGMWWALWTFLLLIAASPIGILIESLTRGVKGSGQRYIKRASGISLVPLCISLFASIIPIKANLAMLPLLILSAIILGILNVWFFSRKVITFIVSIIFITLTLSFIFPATFSILGEKMRDIDISMAEPKRLYPTYESIEKGEFKFFRPDDKPRVWYYKTEDRKFELYDREGPHPVYKEKLKPVTPDIVKQIMKQLKEDAERKAQEERRKKEEAERLEKQKREEAERIAKQKHEEVERLAKQQAEFKALRLRQIWGIAYSYSKEKWAGGTLGTGRYPRVGLEFWSGLVAGYATIYWDGSYSFEGDQLCLIINNLKVPEGSPTLEEYYKDFGVGYFVQLDNAVFAEDYTMAKYLIVFRTFTGDTPPKHIKKCFKIIPIKEASEESYKISGEWESKDKEGNRDFVARIVQSGNKFTGVGIGFGENGKTRTEIEGWIFGRKVTFVQKFKRYDIIVSFVGSFSPNPKELTGFWEAGFKKGEWRWQYKGDFKGSPEDILSP